MRLIDEDALFHPRIFIHYRFRLLYSGIEYPNPGQVAVGDGADDGQQSSGAQEEVSPGMLPDDLLRSGATAVRPGLENYDAVISGSGDHLGHEFVGDFGHGNDTSPFAIIILQGF